MHATSHILRFNPNPVPADGSFREGRLLPALAADYARVDDRSVADWLRYLSEYARRVEFRDLVSDRTGRWDKLYRNQPAVVVAQLLTWDLTGLGQQFRDLRQATEDVSVNLVARRKTFTALFDRLLDAAAELDGLVNGLTPGTELYARATAVIRDQLSADLGRWIDYYLAAARSSATERLVNRDDQLAAELADRYELSEWWTGGLSWSDYLAARTPDDTIYGTPLPVTGTDRNVAILHAVGHAFFHRTYTGFVQAALHLRAAARSHFNYLLTREAGHAPHVALILAMLRVRQQQQRLLNGLVDRHLRLYYTDILRLQPRAAQPHRAYVTLVPKQPLSLPENTVFRGGKDPVSGAKRHFISQRRLAVQAAEIVHLRAVYKRATAGNTLPFYAAEVANSRDGRGEKLPEGVTAWRPFGYRDAAGPQLPPARLGFAVTDPRLRMAAGRRVITLRLADTGEHNVAGVHFLTAELTTEDGWWTTTARWTGRTLEVILEADDPAITDYDEATHEAGMDASLPVLRLTVPGDLQLSFNQLRAFSAGELRLRSNVSGLTDLELPGSGTLNTLQPFYPFGPLPGGGERYRLQHPEARAIGVTLALGALEWKAGAGLDYAVDGGPGYLELTTSGSGWTHRAYGAALAKAISDGTALPPQPADPQVERLTAGYATTLAAPQRLYALLPFGHLVPAPDEALFPAPLPAYETGEDAGALFIGIAGWTAGQQLSLLFQIEEGSADPEADKPEQHLHWAYLDGNVWRAFPKEKLSDGTDQLLRSGIVHLDLPYETDPIHTRQTSGLSWVRLSVGTTTDAVNHLIGIHLNAVEVVQELAGREVGSDNPLPAGTITKLLRPLPLLKSVEQPYATFGGAAVESRSAYFTRSSERLRHRGRGVTEWDVERLVLNRFPDVERVICLPHVRYEDGHYHELAPGHLTVLPLGRHGQGTDQRPFVSLSTREAIADYLTDRISCHARLHVRNPLLEPVRVRAFITLVEGTEVAWAERQVQTDLIGYLSPWQQGGLTELDFAGEVHRLAVVDFLEELPYVNTVHRLTITRSDQPTVTHHERLTPSRQAAVLVSDAHHDITVQSLEAALDMDGSCTCTPAGISHRSQLEFT